MPPRIVWVPHGMFSGFAEGYGTLIVIRHFSHIGFCLVQRFECWKLSACWSEHALDQCTYDTWQFSQKNKFYCVLTPSLAVTQRLQDKLAGLILNKLVEATLTQTFVALLKWMSRKPIQVPRTIMDCWGQWEALINERGDPTFNVKSTGWNR
jgi:hypothetical protein